MKTVFLSALLFSVFCTNIFSADISTDTYKNSVVKSTDTPAGNIKPTEEHIQFTTDDEWVINAKYFPPTKSTYTVILIHSQRSSSAEWNFWLSYLKEAGLGYLIPDLRGHGKSTISPVGSTVTWRRFSVSGPNNDYNKMVRDVEAAIAFLGEKGITEDKIILAGYILGGNLAIKTAAIHPDISMAIAISPALNANDVLVVNPLRMAYGKRPLLLVGGANKERQYKELILINDIARSACGAGNVTLMLEYDGIGQKLITKYNIKRILAWINHPKLPEVIDFLNIEEGISDSESTSENTSEAISENIPKDNPETEQ